MNNVHPIFKDVLAPFAPKPQPPTLEDVLKPYEVDISPSHHAEPIYVTPDPETVKEAAAEVLEKHQRELTDVIVQKVREQNREGALMRLADLYDFTPEQHIAIARLESLRMMREVRMSYRASLSMPAAAASQPSLPPPGHAEAGAYSIKEHIA